MVDNHRHCDLCGERLEEPRMTGRRCAECTSFHPTIEDKRPDISEFYNPGPKTEQEEIHD